MRTPVALAIALAACSPAWGAQPTEELRGFFAAATRILDDPELDGRPDLRFAAIRAEAREMFDLGEAARLSLGPGWAQRTPAEAEEFTALFSDLLERWFIGAIAVQTRIADGVNVTFRDEAITGSTAVVRTTMPGRSGYDVSVDYRLRQRGHRFVVHDVAIDGVSLTANYRAQFARVIQSSSYPELLRQMKEKLPVMSPADSGDRSVRLAWGPATGRAISGQAIDAEASSVQPEPGDAAATTPTFAIQAAPYPGHGPTAAPDRPNPPSYWIQIGAFKHLKTAIELAGRLQRETPRGPQRCAVLLEPRSASPPLARVRIGPFSDREAAALTARAIEARGFQPFIAKERD